MTINLVITGMPSAKTEITYDYIFAGLGASGGLMLEALERRGLLKGKSVLIIEPDAKSVNDKTYCFWAEPEDPVITHYQSIISHEWESTQIDDQPVESLAPLKYYHIRSIDLYRKIANGVKLFNIDVVNDRVQYTTSAGDEVVVSGETQSYKGRLLFDSRPPKLEKAPDDYVLLQSFLGFRVRLSSETFDKGVYEMMDFRVPQDSATQFCYTLPYSNKEALIELTRFGEARIDSDRARVVLHEFITTKYGAFELIDEEIGAIPMTTAFGKTENDARVISLGTRAGMVKPSTGYAFKNMFKHAEALAAQLEHTATPSAPANSRRFKWYDRLLLRILRDQPDKGPLIFKTLFKKCGAVTVLRFLDEQTSPRDEVNIFSRLPILVFMRAAVEDSLFRLSAYRHLLLTLFAAVALVAGFALAPEVTEWVTWVGIVVGLMLVGIPHGALDEIVELRKHQAATRRRFYLWYLGFIGVAFFIWQVAPLAGLLGFLAYSAYHFGQTDFEDWGIRSRWGAGLWGGFVLWSLLYYHLGETLDVIGLMGVEAAYRPDVTLPITAQVVLWSLPVLAALKFKSPPWTLSLLLLVVCTQLPLLPAFALYFIGQHSMSGWTHLKRELRTTSWQMHRLSFPFSLGAWLLFGAVSAWMYFAQGRVALTGDFFIFIACISLPHIAVMHRLYARKETVKTLV